MNKISPIYLLTYSATFLFFISFIGCNSKKPQAEVQESEAMALTVYLDAHTHIASPELLKAKGQLGAPGTPPTSAQELVDSFLLVSGSQKAIVLSSAYIWATVNTGTTPEDSAQQIVDVQNENNFTSEQCNIYPDRLIPFLGVDPLKDYAISEIDRCVETLGMQGLKLHFANSAVDLSKADQLEQIKAVLTQSVHHQLPCIIHFGEPGQTDDYNVNQMQIFIDSILTQISGLCISFAHSTGYDCFPDSTASTFSMLIDADNSNKILQENKIFVDISAVMRGDSIEGACPITPANLENFSNLIESWGVERVFWGSDNIIGYLDSTYKYWPMDAADWNVIASNNGAEFLQLTKE